MKRKGFTLVELLVVITIIALLMSILMPALGRIKQMAYRVMCGTHLSAMGKQIVMYGSYNNETYPIAGNKKAEWSLKGGLDAEGGDWKTTRGHSHAYGAFAGADVTITSSLFLLIKYADATPKQFMCKGDAGVEEFKPDFESEEEEMTIEDAWDFGEDGTGIHCSYTYHMPYWFEGDLPYGEGKVEVSFAISPMSDPGSPLSSDRNPYLDKNATYLDDIKTRDPSWEKDEGGEDTYSDDKGKGNCAAHQREGQNVLFNDTHVRFEDYPNVGVDHDNIYKFWTRPGPDDEEKQVGSLSGEPTTNGEKKTVPKTEEDALLVGETN